MRSPRATHEKRIAPFAATQIFMIPYKYVEIEYAFLLKQKNTHIRFIIFDLRGDNSVAHS